MSKNKTESKWEQELKELKCINGAMYFGSVEEPCSGRETGECCHNEQTYEEAMQELIDFISRIEKEAKEEERGRLKEIWDNTRASDLEEFGNNLK